MTAATNRTTTMPKLDGILETCIHTADMARAKAFYEGVLELQPIFSDKRLTAYAVAGHNVLLVFQKGATGETVHIPGGGVIPGHAGDGTLHVAFAIGKDQLAAWEQRLAEKGIAIEGAHTWSRGGRSIYFRDPDGHLLELATPGLWSVY
jgi:catechol 2,3-dioxygenase-like lactoylglutathione lyase family enzyme